MSQARGRARRHKAGLQQARDKVKHPPTSEEIEDEINVEKQRIVDYLRKQLDIFLQTGGCHKEVMAIGRSLEQLRPKRARDSSEDDLPAAPTGRDFFQPPPA